MPKDAPLVMAETPSAPPYLLGFRGSAAERLIEDIRVRRRS